ncbi:MAG: hypothetical protein CME62_03980 [Halobacteriovoraceae bacterium]|nr:hypothetical protein [Halobacteriovoraceae bacterium]|tara:strand:+ start:19687 stop:20451 length:765 start_codon:yes stop_codon:yes gene_type:complete
MELPSGTEKSLIYIPARNLEHIILDTLNSLLPYINKNTQLLLVDDQSTDQTYSRAHEFITQQNIEDYCQLIRLENQAYYGGNQKIAYRYALNNDYQYIVMVHGDNQYPANQVPEILKLLKDTNCAFAYGSRFLGTPLKDGMPVVRYIGNIMLTKMQNLLLNRQLSEYHSGFRAYNLHFLKTIDFESLSDGFIFDNEIIIEHIKRDYKILAIKIPTNYSAGSSSISYKDSIIYALKIIINTISYKFSMGRGDELK